MKLGKLIALYDDNGISIDGQVQGWFTDDTPKRFEAYGWHVIPRGRRPRRRRGGRARSRAAKAVTDQPTLICCKTMIGKGSPNKAGTARGARRGAGRRRKSRPTRAALGWDYAAVRDARRASTTAGTPRRAAPALEGDWNAALRRLPAAHPELAAEFERRMARRAARQLAAQWPRRCSPQIAAKAETDGHAQGLAERARGLAPALPELFGGSADLTGSNLTKWSGAQRGAAHRRGGNYITYGVREFGMAAIANGMALHGGLIPFGGTFLTFSDYARNALRMAALMKQRDMFVFTHDSIGLGEDGPTHQSVEHVCEPAPDSQPRRVAALRYG